MASHIQDVVDSAHDPKIAIFIAASAVAGEIVPLKFTPILLPVSCLVTVDRAQHRRPGATDDQFSADIWPNFAPFFVHNRWVNAKEREGCAAWLGGNRTGQRRDENRACFGLPPRIYDRATTAADDLVIPHPRLRVNWFADRAEQTK